MEIVSTSWDSRITGNPIYQLTTKLCILKSALRKLHQQHTSHIASRVNQAKAAWNEAQFHLDSNPTSTAAKTSERTHASLYMQLCKDEESMLKQRSRINWLQLGDRNTKFFHNSLLHRQVRNRIHGLQDPTGTTITDQQDMGKLASNYYEHLLSAPQIPLPGPVNYMYPNTISEASRSAINLPITDEDIKAALFSIPDNKSPGPDGYNAYFFKHCWSIIGPNFLAANGGWNFPDIPGLQSTWGAINFGPHIDREDQYIWRLHSTGIFTIKSAWEFLRPKKSVTTLHHLIWFTGHIPRHSFILWLASLGRLRTMDRLHGEITTTNCTLCGIYMETHDHLFFECSYTKSVWTTICHRANQHWPCKPWTQLLHWSATHYNQRNNTDHMIGRLLLSATVYYLWYERNNRVFISTSQPYHTTVEAIYQQIRTRLAHMNIALPSRTRAIWNLQDD
ncbi:hypothetical protein NC653_022191 [Populus alba x Populus x berolinensis]|uniref:Reverse transcriptase zinc-binding domain-containing protein n=1 Tax=Populus alba x Populus x berolinensis TaxID=444605 RepID=A0AAD6QFT6_9ROSI|nr:hypothetical protein NC653_022191 [Populus alba x Populus x berolinensis]